MAHIKDNVLLSGVSGMLGGTLVFRNINGKTFISTRPSKPSRESAPQKATRSKFKDASEYAKNCMLNADKKAYYQARAKKLELPNAYTAAITDYMRSPTILRVDTRDADTEKKIKITSYKKGFAVNNLVVSVKDAEGSVLETKPAESLGNDQFEYKTDVLWQHGYSIDVSNPDRSM